MKEVKRQQTNAFWRVRCIYYDCRCHFVARLLLFMYYCRLPRRLTAAAPSIIIFMYTHRKWTLLQPMYRSSTANTNTHTHTHVRARHTHCWLLTFSTNKMKTTHKTKSFRLIAMNYVTLKIIMVFCVLYVVFAWQKQVTSQVRANRIGTTGIGCVEKFGIW